ncbi:ATP-dependent Clp protease proteolytic subunit [Raphidocelis subcapitata]|uniref:ATP-dependent Clp protease proteolytic subunit n=1 Tax=Raphidocelis subcapitata TaxID=307507 RepID=A0A2V0PJQ3_9CHLO|nr:ATP-dependent Clp protease proteolytic subunit [Raphidocelis subcapitata]|eukprot:GBG00029.1 ATP-dependent Clp protease proteolytic subunit [Raphidocelis subcapitata]
MALAAGGRGLRAPQPAAGSSGLRQPRTTSRASSVRVFARRGRGDRRKPPPPDLPSLLFDQRIVYLGMPLVPAVTELMVAELLYLEKQGASLPIEMLINSSGTTRQDGEILAFDSEGIALTSTMGFVRNPISTVNMGLAVGWSAVVLSFGKKGWRKSLPHSLAMLQQPRVPPTGQRQAIEVHIKWREVLDFKRELLRMLSIGTGWDVHKLDADMQRPLYMRPKDALEYGLIDEIIKPDGAKTAAAAQYWLRSGRAESEGRLEQWKEYIDLQEVAGMKDSFRKARAQQLRECYRDAAQRVEPPEAIAPRLAKLRERLPEGALVDGGSSMRLPFSREGLKMALLNAERYAGRSVERQVAAGRVAMPAAWEERVAGLPSTAAARAADPSPLVSGDVDYRALVAAVEAMDPEAFAGVDLDALAARYARATR